MDVNFIQRIDPNLRRAFIVVDDTLHINRLALVIILGNQLAVSVLQNRSTHLNRPAVHRTARTGKQRKYLT